MEKIKRKVAELIGENPTKAQLHQLAQNLLDHGDLVQVIDDAFAEAMSRDLDPELYSPLFEPDEEGNIVWWHGGQFIFAGLEHEFTGVENDANGKYALQCRIVDRNVGIERHLKISYSELLIRIHEAPFSGNFIQLMMRMLPDKKFTEI